MELSAAQPVLILSAGLSSQNAHNPALITRDVLRQVYTSFSDDIAIFVEGKSDVVGRIVRLAALDDDVYGFVIWSPAGQQLMSDERYPYLDPNFVLDKVQGLKLSEARLTLRPHFKQKSQTRRSLGFISTDYKRQMEVLNAALKATGLSEDLVLIIQDLYLTLLSKTSKPEFFILPLVKMGEMMVTLVNRSKLRHTSI